MRLYKQHSQDVNTVFETESIEVHFMNGKYILTRNNIMNPLSSKPKIVVFGLGQHGVDTINELVENNYVGLNYVVIDSNGCTLGKSKVLVRISLENHLPKGLGVNTTPENCRKAVRAEQKIIQNQLKNADAAIIIAGLGGNTGAGIAPVLSSLCINLCPITIFVGVLPFESEGIKRRKKASDSLNEIREYADNIIMLNSDEIYTDVNKKLPTKQAFSLIDKILCKTVCHIYEKLKEEYSRCYHFETITGVLPREGLISVDTDNNKVASVSIKEKDRIECYSEDRFMFDKAGLPNYGEIPDINSGGVDHGMDFIDIPKWMKKPLYQSLEPRPDGKVICQKLRTMRVELARVNNIPFLSEECTYDGPCAGTCEKCEQESAYLREKLNELSEHERIYPHHIIGKVDDVL